MAPDEDQNLEEQCRDDSDDDETDSRDGDVEESEAEEDTGEGSAGGHGEVDGSHTQSTAPSTPPSNFNMDDDDEGCDDIRCQKIRRRLRVKLRHQEKAIAKKDKAIDRLKSSVARLKGQNQSLRQRRGCSVRQPRSKVSSIRLTACCLTGTNDVC